MAKSSALRVETGQAVDLTKMRSDTTPGFSGTKADGLKRLAALETRLAELQELLFAAGKSGGTRALLLVLQGMDTSGKSGTVKHVLGAVSPLGVHYKGFKAPTPEEKRHGFLWRIRKELPDAGMIGVFDRSHYEDVVTTRVHRLVSKSTIERRIEAITSFEAELADKGTTVVKCFLHISYEEQRRRLLARLDDPAKWWKYRPADVDERELWPDYMSAYADVISRCASQEAPWQVIPADRKWYRNLAISGLLVEAMERMSLDYPPPTFDVDAEKKRLA